VKSERTFVAPNIVHGKRGTADKLVFH